MRKISIYCTQLDSITKSTSQYFGLVLLLFCIHSKFKAIYWLLDSIKLSIQFEICLNYIPFRIYSTRRNGKLNESWSWLVFCIENIQMQHHSTTEAIPLGSPFNIWAVNVDTACTQSCTKLMPTWLSSCILRCASNYVRCALKKYFLDSTFSVSLSLSLSLTLRLGSLFMSQQTYNIKNAYTVSIYQRNSNSSLWTLTVPHRPCAPHSPTHQPIRSNRFEPIFHRCVTFK